MKRALVLAALVGWGCIPEEGPLMEPGRDCLECHGGGGGGGEEEEDARAWTVAGTMGHQGSRIVINDATGWTFTLHAAKNGNFYTAETVRFPLTVSVDGEPMEAPVTYGGCNRNGCHASGGGGGGD